MALAATPGRPQRRIRPARFPLASEIAYRAVLRRLVLDIRAAALAEVEQSGPLLLATAAAYRPDDADARQDEEPQPTGWAALLEAMLARIAQRITTSLLAATARIAGIGRAIDATGRAEWPRIVRSAYGVDVTRGEPGLPDLMSAWETENLALIRSIPAAVVAQLRGEFARAVRNGESLRSLARIVRERTGAADARAQLIAADQTGKLNGQLQEHRQRSIGVTRYRWTSMGDERVRPDHVAKNGRIFEWAKPPPGGHPGQPIRCRCYPDPLLPEMTEADLPLL